MTAVRPARSRARTRLRLVAVAGAAAFLAAACTSSADQTGEPLAGITDTEVKVGYLISDLGSLDLGFKSADYGDAKTIERGIQAVVDWVNENGGAGGRKIDAEIVPFPSANSSPELAASLCNRLTQDSRVFAAVLDGQYQNNVLPCYFNANTLMIDQTVLAHDQAQFEQYKNYLYTPSLPEYGSFLRKQLEVLDSEGFFKGAKGVQLMPSDDEVSRRVTKQVAEPFLKELGIKNLRTDFVDSTNNATLQNSAKNAIVRGTSVGTDRVIAIGGARLLSVALSNFEAREYDSIWSMTTYDNPAFVQNNQDFLVSERNPGMVGIGFSPTTDVATDRGPAFPDPDNASQQLCMDIINQAGATPPNGDKVRENWRTALFYCDSTMFLKAALDNAKDGAGITAADFAEGVFKIGDGFQSAAGFGGASIGENTYAGVQTVRVLAWDDSCKCFDYRGENLSLPAPTTLAAESPAPADASSPAASEATTP